MYILLGAAMPASFVSGCAAASFGQRVLIHFRVRHALMAEPRELLTCYDGRSTNDPPQRETEENAFTHEEAAMMPFPIRRTSKNHRALALAHNSASQPLRSF